ncbi:uncharacterized protein LOC122244880 [Penaeus japonicus]|uniref:uncharacterized protein LOC122244880 n=1 Tax=Penaeus japonicus TaxID=27405 RepID=UPI001C712C15|nr:uncharacterized protein LOC122244880 [Penaeus japonicus]
MRMPQEEEERSEGVNTEEKQALSGIVSDVANFAPVDAPGPLSVENLGPDKELFIVRMPIGMVRPARLANVNLTLDSKKKRTIKIDNKVFSVSAYESSALASTHCIFLPDESGEHQQVNLNIAGQVVLKHEPMSSSDSTTIDIDNLRAVQHQPPSDIRERNFLSRPKSDKRILTQIEEEPLQESPKKKKKKKKQKDAEVEENMEEEDTSVVSPSKKKKHKK